MTGAPPGGIGTGMAPHLAVPRVVVLIAAVVAALLTLAGCTAAEVTNPGGQLDVDDLRTGVVVQVTADAQQAARSVEEAFVVDGVYPSVYPATAAPLTGAHTVTGYAATAAGYTLCVVDPATGAWALWVSVTGGVAGSGESGATCAPV